MLRPNLTFFWILLVVPLLGAAEDKIPPDILKVATPFLTEHPSAAYGNLERWVFENTATPGERARRIGIAGRILVSGEYVGNSYQDYENWVDPLLARISTDEAGNWRALKEAGLILDDSFLGHEGVLVEREFRRDEETGGSKRYSDDRDRFRAIAFLLRAIDVCKDAIKAGAAGNDDLAGIYFALSDCLNDRDDPSPSHLTDILKEPELSTRARNRWKRAPEESLIEGRSAALGADGQIHLPSAPASFNEATSDLARQRWLIEEAARISTKKSAKANLKLSDLWSGWLGVDQLASAGYIYIEGTESELDPNAPGEFELHTLKSDQTILVTATGPKRVGIPPEFRYIEILEKLIADPKTPDEDLADAYWSLIEIHSDRRQFNRSEQLAREFMRRIADKDRDGWVAEDFLENIKPEGRFLGVEPFPAGSKIDVEYLSRNVENLNLELWQLDVGKLLTSESNQHDLLRFCLSNHGDIGFDEDDYSKYISYFTQVRHWNAPIKKLPNHLQANSFIHVPDLEAGHYLLITRDHGKTSGVAINVEETMLIGTPIDTDEANYLLLDSTTGQPVNNAEVVPLDGDYEGSISPDHLGSFTFDKGVRAMAVHRPGRPTEIKESVEATQYDGDATAHREIKTLFVTSQPLYRPGQTVNFSCWIRQPGNRWLQAREAYRDTKIRMETEDPTGRIISTETHALDEFGAFSGSFPLDPDIALGKCKVRLRSMGFFSKWDPKPSDPFAEKSWSDLAQWEVEIGEFRKPDFQVEVAADGKRGDGAIGATVRASYNSGEPMIGAEVVAELKAYPSNEILFPRSEFEWSYGTGYDWPLPESNWMPDWGMWGIRHFLLGESEEDGFISEAEPTTVTTTGTTGKNGELKLEFPVSLPHLGRLSYGCNIRAMAREFSGRNAVGSVDFTESGFSKSLFLRPDKGFYKSGEKITLTLDAMDTNRKPVPTEGSLRVDRLSYEGEVRTPVYDKFMEQPVSIDSKGGTIVSFIPPAPGQYLCMFTSGDARRGIVLNVLADGFEAREMRFNAIQLTPDRSVCAPGDNIEIAIHCDEPDGLVWLFQIMPDGRRQTPRMIRMNGKVAVVGIVAPQNGTPDFQLMAMTARNGCLHQARCQISLPPGEQILAVDLLSSPENPAPGDQLDLALRVRDHVGKPVAASFAITAFDRPLEDLAGPLQKTRDLLPDSFEPFWGEVPLQIANHGDNRNREAFQQLWEPGCFSDRGGLTGRIVRKKESRFSKIGDELLVRYEPPELPNSVGSSGTSFPVTPATPSIYPYSRATASRIDLSGGEAKALKGTTARSNFADQAYWGAAMTTDAKGRAKLSFPLPDNLTAWKAQTWAFGTGNRFGDAELEIPVSKLLQIRPVLPSSAVHGDNLEVVSTVQNLSGHAAEFHLLLEVSGMETNLKDGKGESKTVMVPAGGEGLVSWPVGLRSAGTATFRIFARSTDGSLSDGTELSLIVAPRTTPVTAAATHVIAGKATLQEFDLDLSGMPGDSKLRIRLSAQPALDAFAAIPHLVSYPFGCTEQTINRFLPLLVASKTVERMGGDWEEMMKHVAAPDDSLGWIRGRPLLHTAPAGKNLTVEKTEIIIRSGMKRLDEMANESSNDAWGWFKGGEPSPYLTALALRASAVAKKYGFEFIEDGKPIERISTWWLESHAQARSSGLAVKDSKLNPEDAFIVYVLSLTNEKDHLPLQKALIERSAELPLSGRIFLALSLDPKINTAAVTELLSTIHKEMKLVDESPTFYSRWWEDPVETRAWYLMLLTHLDPKDNRIPGQIDRLLAMRTNGIVWKSTRDTALCIEAIAGTLSVFGFEPETDMEIPLEIRFPGKSEPVALALGQGHFRIREIDIPVSRKDLVDGHLHFTIHRKNASTTIVHASATVSYDADAKGHLASEANGLQVFRNYYLIRSGGTPIPLTDKSELTAGDVVEVELKVQSKHPLEYVHLSDPIPAGLEPHLQLSGHEYGAYRETRLGETHFFIERLNGWNDTFSYRFHAVTPGTTFALPARAECMYAPSVFGSSPPATLTVKPKPGR